MVKRQLSFARFTSLAGVGNMSYEKFITYNIIGGIVGCGYFFGNVPAVKKNFTLVIFAIIFLSLLPAVFEFLQHRRETKATKK